MEKSVYKYLNLTENFIETLANNKIQLKVFPWRSKDTLDSFDKVTALQRVRYTTWRHGDCPCMGTFMQ